MEKVKDFKKYKTSPWDVSSDGKRITMELSYLVGTGGLAKAYERELRVMYGLSDRAVRLMHYISVYGGGTFVFNGRDCLKKCGFSLATMYSALTDLLKARLIVRGNRVNLYHCDARVLLKGEIMEVKRVYTVDHTISSVDNESLHDQMDVNGFTIAEFKW